MSEEQTAQEQQREPSIGLAEDDFSSSLIKNVRKELQMHEILIY